ncbi:hypothetical protein CR513_16785, partial [Mucuna pruriens]
MPFEVMNAPTISMDYINRTFHLFLDKFIIVFINDILFYSHGCKEHEVHLNFVFRILKEKKLYAKLSRCRLKTATEIKSFVGLVGYYGRFIEGFLKIATALNHLS